MDLESLHSPIQTTNRNSIPRRIAGLFLRAYSARGFRKSYEEDNEYAKQ